MNYETWEANFPEGLRDPFLWRMKSYRLALFISDIGWQDVTKLAKDPRTIRISSQLYTALGSISSNIAEGHSRSSGRDRARIHEYALGSANECREWYIRSRFVLGDEVVLHRHSILTEISKLLNTTTAEERNRSFMEDGANYNNALPTDYVENTSDEHLANSQ